MNSEIQEKVNIQNAIKLQYNGEFIDLLDRRKLAKNFVSVLMSQEAKVFSINGGWGSGKTWFLKFIEDECKEENTSFVQYNVWENDYLNDPFSAIIAELTNLLGFSKDQIHEFVSKIKLNANLSTIGGGIGFTYDPNNIPEYQKLKIEKDNFKKLLKSSLKGPVIIAIDELDRCRPDYAIKTLEVIKHFFDIEGLTFILAVDKNQLAKTVEVMFGQGTDTNSYLKKFVDIEYNLPETSKKDFVNYLMTQKYKLILEKMEAAIKFHALLTKDRDGNYRTVNRKIEDVLNVFIEYFLKHSYTLRDIEKFFMKLNIIMPLFTFMESQESDIIQLDILVELLILYLNHQDIYNKFGYDEKTNDKLTEDQRQILANYPFLNRGGLLQKFERYNFDYSSRNVESDSPERILIECAPAIHKYFDKINLSEGFE